MKQQSLFKIHWQHRFDHGGRLRNKAAGRGARPLSTKDPIHMIIKSNFSRFRKPKNYAVVQAMIRRYSRMFYVRVEQVSVNRDHVHLLIRAGRRANFQSFFRVLSGQISQRLTDTFQKKWTGPQIWKYRPYSRVVRGWRAYQIARDYIQLNEKEARGEMPYRKNRLKGLTLAQLQMLWE